MPIVVGGPVKVDFAIQMSEIKDFSINNGFLKILIAHKECVLTINNNPGFFFQAAMQPRIARTNPTAPRM